MFLGVLLFLVVRFVYKPKFGLLSTRKDPFTLPPGEMYAAVPQCLQARGGILFCSFIGKNTSESSAALCIVVREKDGSLDSSDSSLNLLEIASCC